MKNSQRENRLTKHAKIKYKRDLVNIARIQVKHINGGIFKPSIKRQF